MSMLHPYEDRKKLKWAGFQLSEHTAMLAEQKQQPNIEAKPQMTLSEINECLQQAQIKKRPLAVQLNQIVDGTYLPDIEGYFTGSSEEGIYIDQILIPLEEIRHIKQSQQRKWFDPTH
jgi:hypothetical protein